MERGSAGQANRAAVIAAGLALLDPAVVTVALPSLGQSLRAGVAGLQWAVVAYALGVVSLALLADAIGNRYGHRRTLLAGLLAYSVAAVGCGLAPTVGVLVVARLVQGAGAALVIPAAWRRTTATRWIAVAGPAAGGALVVTVGWRAVFFAVASVGIVAIAGIRRTELANGSRAHTRLDVAGSALLVFGLASLATAMTAEPKAGLAGFRVWLGAAAGLIALVAFAVIERRHARPGVGISDREGRPRVIALIPPGSGTALALYTLLVYAAWGGLVFFLLIQLQTVAQYSALGAGLAVLPAAIVLAAGVRGRALAGRIGPRPRLVIGPVLAALGTLLLYRVGPDAIYWRDVLPGTVLAGSGLATFLPSLGAAARAYAVHLVAARVGQLLAVAALPMLAGLVGAAYANPAAFHHGYRVAVVWCAGLFVTGALTMLFAVSVAARGDH